MRCERCGQVSDDIGEESDWQTVGSGAAVLTLHECTECGHRQQLR